MESNNKLKRGLSTRHIRFMALGEYLDLQKLQNLNLYRDFLYHFEILVFYRIESIYEPISKTRAIV